MSTGGINRPHSATEEDSSPEHLFPLQPVTDSDEDIISPECSLPTQPIRDGYSSDDNSNKTDEMVSDTEKKNGVSKQPRKRRPEKPVRLPKNSSSSDITAVDVLFFFDLDYGKSPELPLDLTSFLTVENILRELFKFVSCDDGEDDGGGGHPLEIKINGKTVSEFYQQLLQDNDIVAWMNENDDLNFKTCTSIQRQNKLKQFEKQLAQHVKRYTPFIWLKNVINFVECIMTEYSSNGLNNHDNAKIIFRHLGQLAPLTSNHRHSGEARYTLRYHVSPTIASDTPPPSVGKVFVERDCNIGVHPDSVYEKSKVIKIAVEVYAPQVGSSSTTASEDEVSTENPISKPERKLNGILSKEYRSSGNLFLKQFIASDICRDDKHCMNKILGQHILQLITVAALNNKVKRPAQELLGLFMKNEYIFFSKLKIDEEKLISYTEPAVLCSYETEQSPGHGKITYGNWCLDMTLAKHRIALVAFFMEYLCDLNHE